MSDPSHTPVLPSEVLDLLAPSPGETYLDATAGLGGHASLVAQRLGPSGTVILNDLDPSNLRQAQSTVQSACGDGTPRIVPLHANFAALPHNLSTAGLHADMLLADLGFASTQVDDAARGFSFMRDGPLDMRLDPSSPTTAAELVATLPERELAAIFRDLGEEPGAARVARKIVESRRASPIQTTGQLAHLVRSVLGAGPRGIDPSTRVFQALRIAVNDELGALEALLAAITREAQRLAAGEQGAWLNAGARVAIISFHSLEDRPVKQAFADLAARGIVTLLGRTPIRPTEAEIASNPRSRSAKLRAVRLERGEQTSSSMSHPGK